jgi:hypothetical protein
MSTPWPDDAQKDVEAVIARHQRFGSGTCACGGWWNAAHVAERIAAHVARAVAADRERVARVEALADLWEFGTSRDYIPRRVAVPALRAALAAPHPEQETT